MKIIKPGVLPKPEKWVYTGTCTNCGCQVEAYKEELDFHSLSQVSCPTEGCFTKIIMFVKIQERL